MSIRTGLTILLIDFCMPILMSVDGLKVSFVHTLLVNIAVILCELLSTSIYAVVTHGQMMPTDIGPNTIWAVVLVYAITFSVAVPLFQMLIATCNRIDDMDNLGIQVPIVVLLSSSYVLAAVNYPRLCLMPNLSISATHSVTALAFCWLSAINASLISVTAIRESRARRELAQHAMVARQAKHERIEIEAIARKAESLYMLRHSLANQMRAISNLANSDCVKEADTRLYELQQRAHTLIEGCND